MVIVFFSQQRKNDKKSNKVDRGFYLFICPSIYLFRVCVLYRYLFLWGGGGGTNKYILFDGLVCSIEEYFY